MMKEVVEPGKEAKQEFDPTKSLAVLLSDLGFANHRFVLPDGNVSLQHFDDFVRKKGKEVAIQCVTKTENKGYYIYGSPSVEIGNTMYTLTTANFTHDQMQVSLRINNSLSSSTEETFPVSTLRTILGRAIEKNNMPMPIKVATKIGETINRVVFRKK